jgi:hypothetical protein
MFIPDTWLPDYQSMTLGMIAMYTVSGTFGALVRVAWLDKPIKGLYRDTKGGLKLGFYGEVIVGIAVALLIDGHPIRAGLGAVFAPTILSALQDGIVASIERGKRK